MARGQAKGGPAPRPPDPPTAELQDQTLASLADISARLANSLSKDGISKLLKAASGPLHELSDKTDANAAVLKAIAGALASDGLLKHSDKDVRLLVAGLLSEILRIYAPELPYNDAVMEDVYRLFVDMFRRLEKRDTGAFQGAFDLLRSVAEIKSCLPLLDLENEDLLVDLFTALLGVINPETEAAVRADMLTVLAVLVEEQADELPTSVLEAVLTAMVPPARDARPAGYRLAQSLLRRCADRLHTPLARVLLNQYRDGATLSSLPGGRTELLYEVATAAPEALYAILPRLSAELTAETERARLAASSLAARMFASPACALVAAHKAGLFGDYLGRFTDVSPSVRLEITNWAAGFITADGEEGDQAAARVVAALHVRLEDVDDKVRAAAVTALGAALRDRPERVPPDVISDMLPRLQDRRPALRAVALSALTAAHRAHCLRRAAAGSWWGVGATDATPLDVAYAGVAAAVARTALDRESRLAGEAALEDDLLPPGGTPTARAQSMLAMFAGVSLVSGGRTALAAHLRIKARAGAAVRGYVARRTAAREQQHADAGPASGRPPTPTLAAECEAIGAAFPDNPPAAAESMAKLTALKDGHIFRALAVLADPGAPTAAAARASRDDFLSRVGAKSPLASFARSLALKAQQVTFCGEVTRAIIAGLAPRKGTVGDSPGAAVPQPVGRRGRKGPVTPVVSPLAASAPAGPEEAGGDSRSSPIPLALVPAALDFLSLVGDVFPDHVTPAVDNLAVMLKSTEERRVVAAAKCLARAAAAGAFTTAAAPAAELEAHLRDLAAHGAESLPKLAARALVGLRGPRAMDTVIAGLPAALAGATSGSDPHDVLCAMRAVGGGAEASPTPMASARYDPLWSAILALFPKVARRRTSGANAADAAKSAAGIHAWSRGGTPVCRMRVQGIKLAARCCRGVDTRTSAVQRLLRSLLNNNGELADGAGGSDADCARVRLAAARALLRLARAAPGAASFPASYLALALSLQDPAPEVRASIAIKVETVLRRRGDSALQLKLAAALAFAAVDPDEDKAAFARDALAAYIHRQRTAETASGGGWPLYLQPEGGVPYLLWLLAHHPDFPPDRAAADFGAAYRPFQQMAAFLLRPLLEGGADSLSALVAVLHAVERVVPVPPTSAAVPAAARLQILAATSAEMCIQYARRKAVVVVAYPGDVQLSSTYFRPRAGSGEAPSQGLPRDLVLLELESEPVAKLLAAVTKPARAARKAPDGDATKKVTPAKRARAPRASRKPRKKRLAMSSDDDDDGGGGDDDSASDGAVEEDVPAEAAPAAKRRPGANLTNSGPVSSPPAGKAKAAKSKAGGPGGEFDLPADSENTAGTRKGGRTLRTRG